MNQPDGHDLVFDQTGQQVDLQYNAESIMVVNHIVDGRGGKRCPRCNATPMRQTSIVWDEHTRRVERGTMVLTHLALRVAPPRRPQARHRPYAVRPYLRGMGALTVLALVSAFLGRLGDMLMILAVAGAVGLTAWAVHRVVTVRAARRADRERWEKDVARYERNRERWRRSWFCGACGAKVVERRPGQRQGDRQPANRRRPAGSGSRSGSESGHGSGAAARREGGTPGPAGVRRQAPRPRRKE
ncbi:hypothetical protein ACQSSU_13900 [Micromonospora echinospora]